MPRGSVVQHQEPPAPAGPDVRRRVGHGGGDHVEVIGVAAVLRRDARHQRGGEGRYPFLHHRRRDRQQDAERLGVEDVREDEVRVLAYALPLRAPGPVMA